MTRSKVLILLLFILPLPVFAQNAEVIGRVLQTAGTAQAIDAQENTRTLARRSEIFEGDTVVTGAQGFAQIRMVDGAMLALKEDTSFTFAEYSFDGDDNTPDSVVMQMVRGGFRTISGSIGDDDDDNYRVETQFANIGVRGTTHEGVISFNSLFTGVYDGGTTVSNEFGTLDTGLGGDFDYAVTTQGQPPQGLLQQPGQLGQINLNAGVGDDEEEGGDDDGADDDANDGDGNDDAADDNDDGNQGNDQNDDDGNQAANNDGDGNDAGDNNAGGANNNNAGGNDDGGNAGPNFDGLGAPAGGNNNAGAAPTASAARTGGATTQQNPAAGTGNTGGTGTTDTTPAPGGNTEQAINPLNNIRDTSGITNPGTVPIDTDGDGVPDDLDAFPEDATRTEFIDTDGDGVDDRDDAFPDDPDRSEFIDTDGDGVDDRDDAFPDDPDRSEFMDMDGDGVDDRDDAFPDNPDESVDEDNDGVGANTDPDDNNPDIPATGDGGGSGEDGGTGGDEGDGETDPPPPPVDTDGDGVNDDEDAFPNDPTEDTDSDGDGVGDNADQFPLDPTRSQITPLLSPAQVASIQASGRRGFTLSRNLYESYEVLYPAIYHGAATDGSSGNPLIIVDNIASGIFAPFTSFDGRSSQPYFIFDSTGNVASSSLGFSNGIKRFYHVDNFADSDDPSVGFSNFVHDVEWGIWGPGQGLRAYVNINDDSANFVSIPVPMLWVSTQPTDFASVPTEIADSSGVLYLGDQNFIGGSSLGFLTDFFAYIDFDFYYGDINFGEAEFCIGALGCNGPDDQRWEFEIAGSISGDTVLAYPMNGEINEESVDISGVISGLFTGDNAEAFVGGLNLFSEPLNSSPLEAGTVDGIFLLEREDRIDGYEFMSLLDSTIEEGFLNIASDELNTFGYSQGNFGLCECSTPFLFIEEDTRFVYLDENEDSVSEETYDDNFDVLLQFWNDSTTVLTDNFDADEYGIISNADTFFIGFNQSHLPNIRGHFSDVLEFIGVDEDGTPLTTDELLNFEFDVDFTSGTVDKGYINISVSDIDTGFVENWHVAFDGSFEEDGFEFNILPSNSIESTRLHIAGDVNDSSLFANFSGSIQGAFVDNAESNEGPATEVAFATSIHFEDVSGDGDFSGNYVTGVGLIGGSSEVRFDETAKMDMSRLGLVVPWEESIVYSALATTEVNTPIFADNTLSVPTDPFILPASSDINYVFLNQGADVPTPYNGIGVYNEIILGKWTPGSNGNVVNLNNNVDLHDRTEYFDDVFWSSVSGGGELSSPYITNSLTYGHDVAEASFMGESSVGTIKGVKAHFDASNFLDVVSLGVLSVCAGGSDPSKCSEDSTVFTINFTGTMENGTFTADSITSMTIKNPDGTTSSPTVNGEFEGLFTAKVMEGANDLYDAFVGGFSFSDASMNKLLAGTFVIEREDRVSSSEISDISKLALAVDTGDNTSNMFYSATSMANSSIRLFAQDDSDLIIKHNNDAGAGTLTSIGGGVANPGTFNLTWAIMFDSLFMPDNLILGHPGNSSGFSNASPLLWAHFDKVIPPTNLTGTYRSILQDGGPTQLPFLGAYGDIADPAGTYGIFNQSGNSLDVSFDIDFSLSSNNISNGSFSASIDTGGDGNDTWVLNSGFGGEVKDNRLKFNLIDSGSNNFGTFTPGSGSGIPIDSASLNGSFVNKLSDAFEGEGVVGGFALSAGGSSGSFLDGLFLAGIEEEVFTDFRFEDIAKSALTQQGFIINVDKFNFEPNNPGSYNEGFIYPVLSNGTGTSGSPISPRFLENDPFNPSSPNPENDALYLKENAAETVSRNIAGYDVDWGQWDRTAGGSSVAQLDATLELIENDFDSVIWSIVNDYDAEITGLTGKYTFAKTVGFMGQGFYDSNSHAVTDVFAAFDVDFGTSIVSNGFLRVCAGGSAGCTGSYIWEASFGGAFVNGFFEDTGISGEIYYNGMDIDDIEDGTITGIFTSHDATNNRFNAFAGGFNFDAYNDENFHVAGVFLTERDDRYRPDPSNSGGAQIARDLHEINGEIWDAMYITPYGEIKTGLSGYEFMVYNTGPVFLNRDTGQIVFLGNDSNNEFPYSADDWRNIEFGIWDLQSTPKLFSDNLDTSLFTTLNTPLIWTNFVPAQPFTQMTGRFSTFNGFADPYGMTLEDGAINGFSYGFDDFAFEFDIDFSTGLISNGYMFVQNDLSTEVLNWELEFTGQATGPNLSFSTSTANFFVTSSGELVPGTLSPIDEVNLNAAFADYSSIPTVSGIFGFREDRSGVDTFVQGYFGVEGFADDRFTVTQLQAFQEHVGILDGGLWATSDTKGSPLFAYPASGFSDWGNIQLTHEAFSEEEPNVVARENVSTTTETYYNATFDVGWGLWDDGYEDSEYYEDGVFSDGYTLPLWWLSAKPLDSNLMPTTGSAVYNDVIAFEGNSSNDGVVQTLTAGINVNFGTGALDGNITLQTNDTGVVWDVDVACGAGCVKGSTAKLTPLAGTVHSVGANAAATVTGSLHGIFVGTNSPLDFNNEVSGATPTGFASQFDLMSSNTGGISITGNALIQQVEPPL